MANTMSNPAGEDDGSDMSVSDALGELIDALHDELAYEVSQNPHVLEHVQKACVLLGEPYWGYIGAWL